MSGPPGTPLGPGREFDVIRGLVARWGAAASGIGDDAAVLEVPAGQRLVASTDSSVERVHFRREWLTTREIGYRATAAALSDLAAMAATPLGILISLSLPPISPDVLHDLSDGIGEAALAAEAPILGGDITAAAELVIGITVLGSAERPLARRGARPGDVVYVTGTLGGPLRALRQLMTGAQPEPSARQRFAHPVPRLREARWLGAAGATAGLDISDGLAGDVAHLAHAGGVRITLDLERLPAGFGVDPLDAARSGEEYELAVTAPAGLAVEEFGSLFGIPLTAVGRVEAGEPSVELLDRGVRVAAPAGYSHF